MSTDTTAKPSKVLFWGCFIALVTTAFAFITRAFLVSDPDLWPAAFGLDGVEAQKLFGAGIWSFAISIILFSLVIDKIGYKTAMWISFVCYAGYAILALRAHGIITADPDAKDLAYQYIYWGSVILGLGNGTVEAYINPVVATVFNKEKSKWLNILHAGWPGGLVIGGLITLALGAAVAEDWRWLIYVIAIPAVIYVVMLAMAKFPVNERVASGTSYREMLAEFGILGAAIASYLICAQLADVFSWWTSTVQWSVFAVSVIAFGLYCRSLGRPILIILCLIMIPLATTELGTDGAITGIMEKPMEDVAGGGLLVLIYTSAIMMVLRFFAGSIIHRFSPLGLLAGSAVLATIGLIFLSQASGLAIIFIAATIYGVGKTFFWPTTLGVVSEQTPKGGALTLNAIAGIGMLAVGIIGSPLIGAITESTAKDAIVENVSQEAYDEVRKEGKYVLGSYDAVDMEKVDALETTKPMVAKEIATARENATQSSLAKIAIFPVIMLIAYIGLILYFKSRGGYKPVVLDAADKAEEAEHSM